MLPETAISVQSDVLHATRSPGKRGGARRKEPSGLRWPHGLIFLDAPVCRVLVAGVVAIDNRERRGGRDLLLSGYAVNWSIQAARPLAGRPDAARLRHCRDLLLWEIVSHMLASSAAISGARTGARLGRGRVIDIFLIR